MKNLMKSNIYDVQETIIITGSCLKHMEPDSFQKLQMLSDNIYELCLEETHINMAITKIGGMLRTQKVKHIIFASVDKSPHCIQLHYIQDELQKLMDISHIQIENFIAVEGELINIPQKIISLSKNLNELSKLSNL